MSLIDAARGQIPSVAAKEAVDEADTGSTTRGLSKGAAYQKKQKEARYQAALKVQAALKRGNVQLTEDEKSALELLTRKPGSGATGNFGKPIIFRLFGDNPQIGAKITALDVFQKTGKGFQEVKQLIRKWGEKGTKVSFDMKDKTYTLTAIGALPSNGTPSIPKVEDSFDDDEELNEDSDE